MDELLINESYFWDVGLAFVVFFGIIYLIEKIIGMIYDK